MTKQEALEEIRRLERQVARCEEHMPLVELGRMIQEIARQVVREELHLYELD